MKTPRDILELHLEGVRCPDKHDIDAILEDLDTYYKSKVPKKKDLNNPIKTELQSHENFYRDGYNQAIDDFNKVRHL